MWKLGNLCLMAGFLAGCAAGSSVSAPASAFAGIDRIAVVEINGPFSEAAKNQIGDFVAAELLRKGFVPVERKQVRALLTEQQFQQSDISSTAGAARAGRILNVPAVIVLNVPQYDKQLNLTAKLIKVEDGSILWTGSGSDKSAGLGGSVLAGLGGALGGAVAGHAVSRSNTGTAIGAVAGAAAGVAAADLLSSQQADMMQKTIGKMFEGLIQRPLH